MSRHLRSHEPGGGRPESRNRIEEDEWLELLGERKVPDGGRRGKPANLIRRPVVLPPMRRIMDR